MRGFVLLFFNFLGKIFRKWLTIRQSAGIITPVVRHGTNIWGISSAGSPVGIKTHPQSDSPATIKFPTKELHPRGSLLGFYGGLAQLGARLVSKHTPSQIVLRQLNSQQKTPSKRFASWILWGISSAGSPVGIKTHPQSDSPATIKFPTKELHPRGSLLGFYGGLAQLGARCTQKHTPTAMVDDD